MDAVADLLAEEHDIEAWTITEVQARQRSISRRLVEAIRQQRDLATRYGQAEADYQREYHKTHLESTLEPSRDGWNVAQHESWAKVETADFNDIRLILKEQKGALRSEVDALKTVLELLRSHGKTARELGGGHR